MILFEEIYNKAFSLFDDPKITKAYETNKIVFCKYMYSFFNNISIYEPVIIGQILSDITEPKGEMEVIEADGINSTYTLSLEIPENSQINFRENGEIVSAVYKDGNVTFPNILNTGEEYSIEYYFAGCYNQDFSQITNNASVAKNIEKKVKDILARLLVIAWSESVRDMLTDIQGLLRDTDFKLTPNSQILNSKVNWVEKLQTKNQEEQTKLSWIVRYSKNNGKFTRY